MNNEDAISRAETLKILGSFGITKNMRIHKAVMQLPPVPPQVVHGSPCDLCRYAPPSTCDGKPCAICPAEAKTDGGDQHE